MCDFFKILGLSLLLALPAAAASAVTERVEQMNVVYDLAGHEYRTVKIGKRTWMAENLNYKTKDSYCYDDQEKNCKKYGRLYTWYAALKACPAGWHLPTNEEWSALAVAVGGFDLAGKKLKSRSGWADKDGVSGNGTDDYGFSALSAGYRYYNGGFDNVRYHAYFWSATEGNERNAYIRYLYYYYASMLTYLYNKYNAFSVRCVQD